MLSVANELITSVMGSPWVYQAIWIVCAIDAFLPVVPSEATVIAAGVLAAAGKHYVLAVMALAAVGALVGDHISYGIGRLLGGRVPPSLLGGARSQAARARASRVLHDRGGMMIVALRFVPGGRTATTVTAGTIRYPLSRFVAYDAVAACAWAVYMSLLGYVAGDVFQGSPLLGVGLGVAVSVVISLVAETARRVARRRDAHPNVREWA